MASVSVIIPTYQRHSILPQTVRSVLKQRASGLLEIVIVDQTPEEPPAELVDLIGRNPIIRYVRHSPPSANGARNRGASESSGEALIYIDDDVLLPPRFIEAHVNRLKYPVGAVTGPTVKALDSPVCAEDFREEFEIENGCASWFPGCNFSISREALEATGPFDETFGRFSYCDDVDISVRVREAGYLIAFDENAWLAHLMVRGGGGCDLRPSAEKADERARDRFRHTIYCRWKHRRVQGPSLTAALMFRALRGFVFNRPLLRRGPACVMRRISAAVAEFAALNRRMAEGARYSVRKEAGAGEYAAMGGRAAIDFDNNFRGDQPM